MLRSQSQPDDRQRSPQPSRSALLLLAPGNRRGCRRGARHCRMPASPLPPPRGRTRSALEACGGNLSPSPNVVITGVQRKFSQNIKIQARGGASACRRANMRRPVSPDSCARAAGRGGGSAWPAAPSVVSARVCAGLQRRAPGASVPPRGDPPPACRLRRRPGRDPFYAAAPLPDIARAESRGGGGVVNLAGCRQVAGWRPAARALRKPRRPGGCGAAPRAREPAAGRRSCARAAPAPKFFLFLARRAGLPWKRRVKGTESQTSPQTRTGPPPALCSPRPALRTSSGPVPLPTAGPRADSPQRPQPPGRTWGSGGPWRPARPPGPGYAVCGVTRARLRDR